MVPCGAGKRMSQLCLEMAAYLFCLTSGGGVPIFSRNKADLKPLPFPVIGSLNGVHMFANTHDVSLVSTVTDDSKIVWKDFHDSLTLIIIASDDNANDCHLSNTLSLIFDALVMLMGLDDVSNVKNVERFKKDVKVCYTLVDRLMNPEELFTFSDLTKAVDVIAAQENAVLQNFLDAFTEAASSPYGCLFVQGKVAVATSQWWSLSDRELFLLSQLISSFQPCSARDVPVFLPDASPNVPHRLMSFQLTRGVEVCVLCGPSPPLAELEEEVGRFWRTSYDSLRSVLQGHPRNFPQHTTLDPGILGFLLVNIETNRCLSSVYPHYIAGTSVQQPKETMKVEEKCRVLRSFYKHVVGTYFTSKIAGSEKGSSEFTHNVNETYIVTDTHKCYAMSLPPYQLFVLYSSVPTFAMRSITQKTLTALVKDKHVVV